MILQTSMAVRAKVHCARIDRASAPVETISLADACPLQVLMIMKVECCRMLNTTAVLVVVGLLRCAVLCLWTVALLPVHVTW